MRVGASPAAATDAADAASRARICEGGCVMFRWTRFDAARPVLQVSQLALALVAFSACGGGGDDDVVGDGTTDGGDPGLPDVDAQIEQGEDLGADTVVQIEDELIGADEVTVICKTADIGAALNDGEILHAEIALDLSDDPEVLDFAQLLIDEHSANTETAEIILADRGMAFIPSQVSDTLAAEAELVAQDLEAAAPEDFDALYLDTQIVAHAQASVIVDEFANQAPDPELGGFWSDTGDAIEGHLDVAVELRQAR
jgi:putative membrane protein